MKIDRNKMELNLPKKGFVVDSKSHHKYYHHEYNGKKTGAYTYVSHGGKLRDYAGPLLTQVRKQLKLTSNKDAVDLAMCPMDGNVYNQKLIESGVFNPEEL